MLPNSSAVLQVGRSLQARRGQAAHTPEASLPSVSLLPSAGLWGQPALVVWHGRLHEPREGKPATVDPLKVSRHYRRAAHPSRRAERRNGHLPQPTLRPWRFNPFGIVAALSNAESHPKARIEAGAGRLQAKGLGYALLCSSLVALVLLLFSSYSARVIPARPQEQPSASTERPPVFDCPGLAGIHNGVSYPGSAHSRRSPAFPSAANALPAPVPLPASARHTTGFDD